MGTRAKAPPDDMMSTDRARRAVRILPHTATSKPQPTMGGVG